MELSFLLFLAGVAAGLSICCAPPLSSWGLRMLGLLLICACEEREGGGICGVFETEETAELAAITTGFQSMRLL